MGEAFDGGNDELTAKAVEFLSLLGQVTAKLSWIALRDLGESALDLEGTQNLQKINDIADKFYGPEWREGDVE